MAVVARVEARYPEIAAGIELRVREQLSQRPLDTPQEAVASFDETTRAVFEYCLRCVAYGGVLRKGFPSQAVERVRWAARNGIRAKVMVARYHLAADVLWEAVVQEIVGGGFSPEVQCALLAEAAVLPTALLGRIDREIIAAHEAVAASGSRSASTAKLTPREWEILGLLRNDPDCTNEQLAQAMTVTVETVRSHLKNMFEKTGVRSRHQLASLEFIGELADGGVIRLACSQAQFALASRAPRYPLGGWGARTAALSRVPFAIRRAAWSHCPLHLSRQQN
jgi:DNA-binding CsgD family transcriptional regulator